MTFGLIAIAPAASNLSSLPGSVSAFELTIHDAEPSQGTALALMLARGTGGLRVFFVRCVMQRESPANIGWTQENCCVCFSR